jgi:hypothetical protein
MVHQADLVIGIRFPRPVDLYRAGGLAAGSVAQISGDAAVLPLEFFDRVERRVAGKKAMVEFNPPPGISKSGKPEPASS